MKGNFLLLSLFHVNQKSANGSSRKLKVLKNIRTGQEPLIATGIIRLIRFNETGTLEDSRPWPLCL